MTGQVEYRLTDVKLCMYDPQWQGLRVTLLGKWTTVEGTRENITRLQQWITYKRSITALWQVLNLLNATRMGYSGQGLEGSPQDKLVEHYRDNVSAAYKAYKLRGDQLHILTQEEMRENWSKLSEPVQKAVLKNLQGRLKKHEESAFRDELRYFIDTITADAAT